MNGGILLMMHDAGALMSLTLKAYHTHKHTGTRIYIYIFEKEREREECQEKVFFLFGLY